MRKIGVILIILIVLVASVLAYVLIKGDDKNIENNSEFNFLDSCLSNCGSCKQNCYDIDNMEKAQNALDKSLCDKIKNSGIKQECLFSVILSNAVQTQDNTLCEEIENEMEKEICVNAVEYSLNPSESFEE